MQRLAGLLALVAASSAACESQEGSCRRMSDCAPGLTCVEGMCQPNGAPSADRDGAAPNTSPPPAERPSVDPAADPSSDASVDASSDADLDASSDAGLDDAPAA